MRATGPALFTGSDLRSTLLSAMGTVVRDDVIGWLLELGVPSRLHLKRVAAHAIKNKVFGAVELGAPSAVTYREHPGQHHALLEADCSLSIKGDAGRLDCSIPLWPAARSVRGRVRAGRLTLTAEGHSGEREWLAAVLASELAEIERIFAGQLLAVKRLEQDLEREVRDLIDRIYPNIDLPELQRLAATYRKIAGPDDLHLRKAEVFWRAEKKVIWSRWGG